MDARLFEVRATVLGVESEPMRVMQKRKQRNRKIKSVRSKHRYTELVVGVLRVKPVGEIVADAAVADHPLID